MFDVMEVRGRAKRDARRRHGLGGVFSKIGSALWGGSEGGGAAALFSVITNLRPPLRIRRTSLQDLQELAAAMREGLAPRIKDR